MSQPDWQSIREDYEGGMSLRTLAAKYSLSKSVIGDRKYKEQWIQERTALRTPPTNSKPTTRDVNAAVRVQQALKHLLEGGKTWDEVAALSGYGSRGAAHHAVMRELERCISQDVEELRKQELYMITQLQARCYKAGIDEENAAWTWAIDRFNTLSKRKSELMGLDAAKDGNIALAQTIIREVPPGYLSPPPELTTEAQPS